MMRGIRQLWAPPPQLSTTDWANKYRYLAPESSAMPGKYSTALTPWVPGMHAALDDPAVYKVVCMKAAQVAWTDGVINNWLGRTIDLAPVPVIGLFAKTDSAKEFAQEKLAPMVVATPRLRSKLDVETSRKDGNRALFKKFAGGFLKLVGSNSPSNVKSTPAPFVFVEEPDDAAINVGKQGDSIKLLEERTKTFHRRKIVFGGTPSVKGISTIEDAFNGSDQRKFYVPCHECSDTHVLAWENVHWITEAGRRHEIYGDAVPESAVYSCPHCGVAWNDHQKNRNVRKGEWIATAEFRGVAGFYINELYSPFPGSRLTRLVERYLDAQHKFEQGDETDKIVFINSCLGLPYEYESNAPEASALQARGEEYDELTVPAGGLILTAGVDVQHNRVAVTIWAWGRGEECWLVYWGELHAKTSTTDINDPVWNELAQLLFSAKKHADGFGLMVSAVSIDASDGQTSDQVYTWVRKHQRHNVMAVKGSSDAMLDREIFSKPRPIDTRGRNNSKAHKHGLHVFIVGTQRAKDLLIGDRGRLTLQGNGPGRMHWYQTVRADFYEQITSEVKAPHRTIRKKLVWQVRAGVRNEGLDCTVYALHAARSLRLHLMRDEQWDALEAKLKQQDLFSEAAEPAPPPQTKPEASRKRGGYINRYKN